MFLLLLNGLLKHFNQVNITTIYCVGLANAPCLLNFQEALHVFNYPPRKRGERIREKWNSPLVLALISLPPTLSLPLYLSLYLSLSLSLSLPPTLSLSTSLSIYLYLYLSLSLHLSRSILFCSYLSFSLSFSLSLSLPLFSTLRKCHRHWSSTSRSQSSQTSRG